MSGENSPKIGSANRDSNKKENRMGHLDFIRGMAIIGVLIVHMKIFLIDPASSLFYGIASQGARGVQLFYILSAFTLFMSLSNSNYIGTSFQTAKYFIRRIFRILPMFYVAIIVYVFWLHPTLPAILSTITFAANFLPQYMEGLVVGQWSVMIEMFFYLLVPLFFLRIKSRQIAEKYFVWTLVGSSLFLLSMILFMSSVYPNVPVETWYFYVFFSLPVQLPHFMLGFLTFFLLRDMSARSELKNEDKRRFEKENLWKPIVRIFLWTIGTEIVFVLIARLLTHRAPSSMISPIIYAESAFLVLFFVLVTRGYEFLSKASWFTKTIEYIGKVSFSMYLTHWIVLAALTHNKYYENFAAHTNGYVEFAFLITVGTAFIVAVSSVTYNLIEKRGQKLGSMVRLDFLNHADPVGHPKNFTVESGR